MEKLLFACFSLLVIAACEGDRDMLEDPGTKHPINFEHPVTGQVAVYLGFEAAQYYNYTTDAMTLTGDTLVMEILGEDAFGFAVREYYTSFSPVLADPDPLTDTAYYSFRIQNDSIAFDWDAGSGISPRGRLFDFGVRYPLKTEPYVFDQFGWKVFPSSGMPQFGVTGSVPSYTPLDESFGTCQVRYDVGTVFGHSERPIWIYQSSFGLIARYTEFTPGGYVSGFILTSPEK